MNNQVKFNACLNMSESVKVDPFYFSEIMKRNSSVDEESKCNVKNNKSK